MATRKRGLGKGLEALLSARPAQESAAPAAERLRTVPIELLQRSPYQPRTHFAQDSLQELADSIRTQGIIQPIVARPLGNGQQYEIIAGERRWRAAQLAGLHEVPALIHEIDDQAAMCLALIENIQREDLNPIEQAQALHRLLNEFSMTHAAIAAAVGRSRSAVTNLLRLLGLSPQVKRLLEQGSLSLGHARALLTLSAAKQIELAEQIAKHGLSVRAIEERVKKLQSGAKPKTKKTQGIDPNIRHLQDELSEKLGAAVKINCDTKGKGSLRINYNSLDELDGILKHIK